MATLKLPRSLSAECEGGRFSSQQFPRVQCSLFFRIISPHGEIGLHLTFIEET